jgi:hypothetical protein
MIRSTIAQTWDHARQIDPTLMASPRQLKALASRELRPVAFSRNLLFSSMAKGKPVLFKDLPVPVRGEDKLGPREALLRALDEGFSRRSRVLVRCGPSGKLTRIPVAELVRRWASSRARVSVTDLHIRGTPLTKTIDCSCLSDFNILAEAGGAVAEQEMLTMVVSSAGVFTDSHTDDPDGSNHCFVGRKLWLVWDTFSGLSHNLEDCERIAIETKQAAFSISGFLSVPHSRWFFVEPNQTLFLPGHLTHKVITLDDYLGVGSFFVMLPSYLRTLARWTERTPLWALTLPPDRRLDLVDKITRCVINKVRALASAPRAEASRWGLTHLGAAVRQWQQASRGLSSRALLDNPVSTELVMTVLGSIPGRGQRTFFR